MAVDGQRFFYLSTCRVVVKGCVYVYVRFHFRLKQNGASSSKTLEEQTQRRGKASLKNVHQRRQVEKE